MRIFVFFVLLNFLVSCQIVQYDNLKIIDKNNDSIFPPAIGNQEKHVINLPAKENESMYRIEIVQGKFLNVESCNQYSFFTGEIVKKELKNYGYNYYTLNGFDDSKIISTTKYCPENKTDRFIPITNSILYFIYNSKLPIVLYTPKNVKIKYRIFKKQSENYLIKSY